jgi:hypothetical protein
MGIRVNTEMKARDEYYPLDAKPVVIPEKRHPSCPGCGREWLALPMRKCVGGASVEGPVCRKCIDELRRND